MASKTLADALKMAESFGPGGNEAEAESEVSVTKLEGDDAKKLAAKHLKGTLDMMGGGKSGDTPDASSPHYYMFEEIGENKAEIALPNLGFAIILEGNDKPKVVKFSREQNGYYGRMSQKNGGGMPSAPKQLKGADEDFRSRLENERKVMPKMEM